MSDLASTDMPADPTRESSRFKPFWTLLQAELSSYPGRPLLVLRIVMACTIVMFCIMVFRIPGGVLGAYSPLLISRDNLHATRRSAIWIAGASVAGAVGVVLGAMLFTGSPFLHLAWVCISLFAVFYLVSILRIYEAALTLGLFVTNSITIWDQTSSPNLKLSQTLFMLLSILLGCGASLLIEYLFSRIHPPDAVIGGIQERLALTERVLHQYAGDDKSDWNKLIHELKRYSARGTSALRAFVAQAGYTFEEEQRLSTAVALAGRLVDLSTSLIETASPCTADNRELCIAASRNLSLLRKNLSHSEVAEWIDIGDTYETSAPILIEIERTIELLAESFSQSMWDGKLKENSHQATERIRILVTDAFTSRSHLKFAIRGALSAIACYMFYMSVGWIGLNASIATCILTALPVTGAARHKQLMRFAGVVLGACALGFTAQIIILPQIDSIFSYMLLFACVTFLGAWVSSSGPRIAYCGVQIVLAYELVNLGRFSLNSSLVPARDTVFGIVLGIGAMWLIFDHLWETSSAESIRSVLCGTIREIADLAIEPTMLAPATREALLTRKTGAIMKNFEKLWSLADVSIFEAFPKAAPDEILLQRAQDYLPQLRAVLLIKTGLIHHQEVLGNTCQSDMAHQVQEYCTHILHEIAECFDTDRAISRTPSESLEASIQKKLRFNAELIRNGQLECDMTELHLCSSLFEVVHHLTIT
jgi:multidrug resistance protein MdtO